MATFFQWLGLEGQTRKRKPQFCVMAMSGSHVVVYAKSDTKEGAIAGLLHAKRRGRTAWIEDSHGKFIPVKGAKRKPGSG
jgi:hypothetical protein